MRLSRWTPGRPDFERMLEVLYDFAAPQRAWLEGVHQTASRFMPGVNEGLIAPLAIEGTSPDELRGVGRAQEGWASDPALLTMASLAMSTAPSSYFRGRMAQPVGTEVQLLGREYAQTAHGHSLRALGYADWLNVSAVEDDGTGLNMGFPLPRAAEPWPVALVNEWHTVARHIVSCLRVRAASRSGDVHVEAVFSPDGRVIDAMGAAVADRELLRGAVRRIERSRARGRDRPSALEARPPRAGVRWILVDRFDGDGKHFVVAFALGAPKASLAKLSPRERRIAEHIAAGWSMKLISSVMASRWVPLQATPIERARSSACAGEWHWPGRCVDDVYGQRPPRSRAGGWDRCADRRCANLARGCANVGAGDGGLLTEHRNADEEDWRTLVPRIPG